MRYLLQSHLRFLCITLTLWCALWFNASAQQKLQAGFDAKEYVTLLQISARQADTPWTHAQLPYPTGYTMVYRSPEVGLLNRWDLWLSKDSIAVISIRGTTVNLTSWMENFYSAMVPACGALHFTDGKSFSYKLANDSNAQVHVGWLIGMSYLVPDIIQKIKEYRAKGIKQFVIMGHSQGGAIAYLLRSYLYYSNDETLPKDIIYKTYCSAAPKPGNYYYAGDYDFITGGGWGLHVVNTRDWVPQTPVTLQTVNDFNKINPFSNAKPALKHIGFFKRMYISSALNSINRHNRKVAKVYKKYFGKTAYKLIIKSLPPLVAPVYSSSSDYCAAGTPVILVPTAEYNKTFVYDGKNIFLHHFIRPYYFLTMQYYLKQK